ncbi:MAG: PorP/SprF family type IX secretion system membrane protein [Bacteroidota bacterium]
MGGQIVNTHEGPFNQLMTQASASYKVFLEEKRFISFGLSVGFVYNNFNIQALDDPNDPALASVAVNEINLASSAGLGYTHNNWKVGLSLPHLLTPYPTFEQADGYQPWDFLIASASYTYQPSTDWKLTPTIFYYHYGNFANQLEDGLKVDYRNKVWLGGLFRQDYRATAFLGVDTSPIISVNYLYTFSSVSANLPNDSHEIVLGMKFGKKNK